MTVMTITPIELKKMMDDKADFVLLDVREQDEYDFCNLGGMLIPLGTLADKLSALDKTKHYVVHCRSGGRSHRAVEMMTAAGFHSAVNLTGGILGWAKDVDANMPVY